MTWRLKTLAARLLETPRVQPAASVAAIDDEQSVRSRREMLSLGLAGVCALAGTSVLAPSRASAATVLDDLQNFGEAEIETADMNDAADEADVFDADLDDTDLDDAELIDIQSGRRRRRGGGRRGRRGGGRRRARGRSRARRRTRPRARPRSRARRRGPVVRHHHHYYRRRRRRRYAPWELHRLCRSWAFRRDFPFLCVGYYL